MNAIKRLFVSLFILCFCVGLGVAYHFGFHVFGESHVGGISIALGLLSSYFALTGYGDKFKALVKNAIKEGLDEDRRVQAEKSLLFTGIDDSNELRVAFWMVKPTDMVKDEVLVQRIKDAAPTKESVKTGFVGLCTGFANSVQEMEDTLQVLKELITEECTSLGLEGIPGVVRLSFRGTSEMQTAVIQMLNGGVPKAIEFIQYDFKAAQMISRGIAYDPNTGKFAQL